MSPPPLGILAGQGIYPKLLFDEITKRGRSVVVAGMKGQTERVFFSAAAAYELFHLGAVSRTAAFFHRHGATTVYFAGGVGRARAWRYCRPDVVGLSLLITALVTGDDRLLKHTADAFQARGVTVADPNEFIRGLFPARGHLAGPCPTPGVTADLAVAFRAAKALGARDKGQGAVVKEGRIVALETTQGTDQMIARAGEGGGVLVKAVKPGQDRRFDLPAVGVKTVIECKKHGLRAVGIEADGVLMLEKERIVEACDREGITLVGMTEP